MDFYKNLPLWTKHRHIVVLQEGRRVCLHEHELSLLSTCLSIRHCVIRHKPTKVSKLLHWQTLFQFSPRCERPTITSSSSNRREGRRSTPTAARRLQLCWGCSWLINLPQELSADAWPCFLLTGCMFPSIVLLLGDKRLLLGLGKGATAVLTVGLLSLCRGLPKSFGAQQVWRKKQLDK